MLVSTTIQLANLEPSLSPSPRNSLVLLVEKNVHPLILAVLRSASSHFLLLQQYIEKVSEPEICVSEPRIRHQLILFISYPLTLPCLCLQPPLFLAAQIIDQPPSVWGTGLWRRSRGGGNFIGLEPNNLINIAPLAPFSFFLSLSLLPQSLGCNVPHFMYFI